MKVALGAKLKDCPAVRTLGVRCNWDDYNREEHALIKNADCIYFPTIFYADILHAAGKSIFPSMTSYQLLGDKIRQYALFRFLDIPMPHTRLFFGSCEMKRRNILSCFHYPFIGKIPRGSGLGKGVFLIRDHRELSEYLAHGNTAYIQEYIPMDMDLRVVILGRKVVHAYWKRHAPGNFRTNVGQGGEIILDENIPEEALELAENVAAIAGIDHAGIDLCLRGCAWMVLEANINFGTEGFHAAGLELKKILCGMVSSGEI